MHRLPSVLLLVIVFGLSTAPAATQNRQKELAQAPAGAAADRSTCFNGPPSDDQIAACTRLIASGQLRGGELARAYLQRGRANSQITGAYDSSIADAGKAIQIEPGNAGAYALRGAVLVRKGKLESALADLNKALRLDPNNAGVHNGFGIYYNAKGDYDRALAELTEAIRLFPQFLNAYRTRGLVYETKGQLANALADFRAAANLDPEKKQIAGKEAAQGIGRVEPKIGAVGGRDWTPCINGPHGEEKIAACTNLIASGKLSGGDLARAYMLRGTSYAILTGDCDRAIPDYTESIKLDPNNVIAHAIRGACLVRKGNFDRALADLNEARRLNSNHVNTRNSFGFYYIARGEYDLALQELNEAIRANPQFLAAYKNRGIAYENKGELSAALSDFRMAVSLDPAQRLLNAREAAQGIARIEQRLAAGRNPEAAAATPVAATPQIPAAVPPPLAVVPGRRFALVIGNDKYESLPVLQKAVNDARAVAERLTRLGFEVILVENATRRAMNEKLTALTGKLGRGDSAFFFFAGHGVAIKDGNYLLPIDTPQAGEGQEGLITREGIAADSIIDALQERGARVVVMVLDACRDNPFKKTGSRGVGGGRGLGEMRAPEGVFVLYSAGFGQSALDRLSDSDPNSNSVFTRTFVRLLEKPGLTLQELAKLAQTEVRRLSGSVNHVQMPAYYDQIDGALALR